MSLRDKIRELTDKVAYEKQIYFPSEESVTISLEITDKEKEEFLNDCWFEENNYVHFEFEDNTLILTYSKQK